MNKKTKEIVYFFISKCKKDKGKKVRVRLINNTEYCKKWLVARIKDGHRLCIDPERLTVED